ncbi:DISP complex protein LRCH3 isoform X2 [Latimeria chalumnae]|uniref:DISP complex protein LRCH3 isoform X2 n=1 Tax=Latimeria chalumnae TaxID=7897 RepID=UPI00313F1EFD
MVAGDESPLPAGLVGGRSLEKALDEAVSGGVLNLSGRKLKEFPRSARNYDLSDIIRADLSKNRLSDIPEEICQLISLEALWMYHNCVRSIPQSIANLQALTYLNIGRNQLTTLPPYLCCLPLKVLIISNNKLAALPDSIGSLASLRQLDASCNELQSLPTQIGNLESLRDLNVRRNHITTLPDELSELPLVRVDFSCNRISRIPVCYRHLRHLQSIILDNNPLQSPPAQICTKGKIHIFKYLNIEACNKTVQDLAEFERSNSRPTGFGSCLSDEFYPIRQYGGLDSGFNSVDSGNKRWSGNESTDEFSDLSLRIAELSREQKQLKETQQRPVNGYLEEVDYIGSSLNGEEDEDVKSDASSQVTASAEDNSKTENVSPQRSGRTEKPLSTRGSTEVTQSREECPSAMEERRRPETLQIWQERERQQALRTQNLEKRESFIKCPVKTSTSSAQTQSVFSGSQENSSLLILRSRSQTVDPAGGAASSSSTVFHSTSRTERPLFHSSSSPVLSPKESGAGHKPSSFLFRSSSRNNVQPNTVSSPTYCPLEPLPAEFRSTVRLRNTDMMDSKELIAQLRKNIETRLKITLPNDLGEALSNGAILCHLANHCRPRSISIIHVPSPAVPKLSKAKSMKNIENFIEACRKMGVSEELLCRPQHILEEDGLAKVAVTVQALLSTCQPLPRKTSLQDL